MQLLATFTEIDKMLYHLEIVNESSLKSIIDRRNPNLCLLNKAAYGNAVYPGQSSQEREDAQKGEGEELKIAKETVDMEYA